MSFRPSPVMSASRTRPAGSSKNTSGKASRSWRRAIGRGGAKPCSPRHSNHRNCSSRVISASERPSPVRSSRRTLGSCGPKPGEVGYGVNLFQAPSGVVSKKPGERAGVHQQVGDAVAGHVAEADPRLVQGDAGRHLGERARPVESAVAQVAPVAEAGRAGVQDVRQAVAEQVDQGHAGMVQAQRGQLAAPGLQRVRSAAGAARRRCSRRSAAGMAAERYGPSASRS